MKREFHKRNGIRFLRCIVVVATVLFVCVSARGESTPKRITDNYFCMHVHSHPNYEKAFSTVPFGMLRTWDSSIGWPQLEPEKGKWNWDLLDTYVKLSREKNIRLIMTLGMTPRWAAKNPDAPTPYGGAWSSSPPRDIADWENFIRKVAERNETVYGGAIRYWEVWNEPDNFQAGYSFYTGTVEELIDMARAAHGILKEVNTENMILAPGITQIGQGWLGEFLKGGGRDTVDIIGYHFYWVFASPAISDFERGMASLKQVAVKNGCGDKPIWVTETGFDVNYFKTQEKKNMALAAMMIAPRYYGADAVCAYSWNGSLFTNLYDNDKQQPTPAAASYIELHKWLDGAAVTDLKPGKGNSKVFTLDKNGKAARIVLRYGAGKVQFRIDDTWGDKVYRLDGTSRVIPSDRMVELGNDPIMIQ